MAVVVVVVGGIGELQVKLQNIYISPSLVTYFTQTLRINYRAPLPTKLISSLFSEMI